MVGTSLVDFNNALAKLKAYTSTPEAGMEIYGKKLRGVCDQFGRFVEPKDFMNEFELLFGGQTQGLLPRKKHVSITKYVGGVTSDTGRDNEQSSSAPPASNAAKAFRVYHRWKATLDSDVLKSIIENEFSGVIPSAASEVRCLVSLMPVRETREVWDGGKLRKRAK